MSIYDLPVNSLEGEPDLMSAQKGKVTLVVNVASKCGLTPQYTGLEKIHEKYADRGFSVLGFPCNQFMGQEPGTPEEIRDFCTTQYNVTFPLAEKIDVNGAQRHPIYAELTKTADAEGHDGDIRWNFEKFLVAGDGSVIARFAPTVEPESPEIVEAIEKAL
ncbi:MAG TPA: glutathione peroxidase [Acidimicrobiia bacterium]|nr:glutathione peroxidase [Acidimicrobiia bacterium]